MQDYSIWPMGKAAVGTAGWDKKEIKKYTEVLERKISDKFSGIDAIIFPSCRAAIYSIMEIEHLTRSSHVYISDFSSNCVIGTVGRIAMPTTKPAEKIDVVILHHQYGFEKRLRDNALCNNLLIEDSCDSIVDAVDGFFQNKGDYEVFSLPKLFATGYGGVVMCKNEKRAEFLKNIRWARNDVLAWKQFEYKQLYYTTDGRDTLSYDYWSESDAKNGYLPLNALQQIDSAINKFDFFDKKRKKRIEKIYFTLSSMVNLPMICEHRKPPIIPVEYDEDLWKVLQNKKIQLPIRYFNFSTYMDQADFRKSILIPIHCGIADDDFVQILSILKEYYGRKNYGLIAKVNSSAGVNSTTF